ncbi:MAG: hypothetical protein IKV67_03345 [Paludibacteraceae bacterium]|nr:hypothetical protein [Paludibacteraceae bacterium]
MADRIAKYITENDFTILMMNHCKFDGYVIGVGLAFTNEQAFYQYLDPFLKVRKMGESQYLDTSYEQYEKSFNYEESQVVTADQILYGKLRQAQSEEKTEIPQKLTKAEREKERECVANKSANNSNSVNNINNAVQSVLSTASYFGGERLENMAYEPYKMIDQKLIRNWGKLKPFMKVGVNKMTDMDLMRIISKDNNFHSISYSQRYNPLAVKRNEVLSEFRSIRGADASKIISNTTGGIDREALNVATYGEKTASRIRFMKGAGKAAVVIQGVVSGATIYDAFIKDDPRKGRIVVKSSLDMAVALGLCVLGGPVGWGLGIAYIAGDVFGVWDSAIDETYYYFNPEQEAIDKRKR